MRILLTGAYGFIGRHVVAGLRAAGHQVTGCGRDVVLGRRLVPDIDWRTCDFNRDVTPAAWRPRLDGVDAVINCAGTLQAGLGTNIDAVHRAAPIALFDACAAVGVKRIIQISALGIDPAPGTRYADTKAAADAHLATLDLDWVILRPSLVVGRGSFGGTSLFRGLAALPLATPLPGPGTQRFQPLHLDDLVAIVVALIDRADVARRIFDVGGPDIMTLRDIVIGTRRWLGLRPAPVVAVPMPLIRLAGRLGDGLRWLGGRGPLTSTAVQQMEHGCVGDPSPLATALGFAPQTLDEAWAAAPSQVQDRWHARLYFLRPVLRIVLALFWIATGAVSIGWGSAGDIDSPYAAGLWFWTAALADLALGAALLIRWRVRLIGSLMIVLSLAYLAIISVHLPALWTDPLGPATKILPIIMATLVMMAIEDDR